jgi:hypothetical protein
LLGAPEWAQKFPWVPALLTNLGLPDWSYGLAASVTVACYFAWQLAKITTPCVVPRKLTQGYPEYGDNKTYYRIEVENVSSAKCDRMMCQLTAVYIGWPSSDQNVSESYCLEDVDFPLILTTQNRLRDARKNKQPLPQMRWNLDQGETKHVEVFQTTNNSMSVVDQGGEQQFDCGSPVITFELKLSGGIPLVTFWIVVFRHSGRIKPFLVKRESELSTLQQLSSTDVLELPEVLR